MKCSVSDVAVKYQQALRTGDVVLANELREQMLREARALTQELDGMVSSAPRIEQSKSLRTVTKDYKELIGLHREAKSITNEIGTIKRAFIKGMRKQEGKQ